MDAELKRARVQLCRQRKREAAWNLPARQKLVVVASFVLSQWDRPLAEAVVLMLREQVAGTIITDQMPVPVRDWLLEVQLEMEEGFIEPTNRQQYSVRAKALK